MKRPSALALTAALVLTSCSSANSAVVEDPSPIPATSTTSTAPNEIQEDEPTTSTALAESSPADAREPLVDIEARSGTPDTPSRYAVAYYGDSLAASAQEWVGTFIERGGRLEFLPGTFPGSSICDWQPRFDEDIATYNLWAVVLFFVNNVFSPCMKNPDGTPLTDEEAQQKFRSDLVATIDQFTAAGATVYLPTIPMSRGDLILGISPNDDLNRLFTEIAGSRDNVVLVDAATAVLDENGRYTETLPCLPTEPCTGGVDQNGVPVNLVREPDGVHFCSGGYGPGVPIETDTCPTWSSGAFRYGGALAAPIVAAAQAEWAATNPPNAVPDQVYAAE